MVAALLLVIALLSCSPAYAQGTGDIWGRVFATTGESVADAVVTVTNVDTSESRHTKTDGSGLFGFALLLPGHYQVTAVHDGFAGRRQDDIALLPGQRMQLNLPLRRAPLPETISLNPYPPIMESARTHASAFIAETEIDHLPVIGRRYLRFAQLTPAVTLEEATGSLSVMNLPGTENRLLVDGFDHSSSVTGTPIGHDGPSRVPYEVSAASVQAFRIQTNAAPAENGRAAASVFDVVTKSGANAFHGAVQDYFGDRTLNGKTSLDERAGLQKPAYRNNQFSAFVGGPIVRSASFFLVSYDGLARTDAASVSPNTSVFAPVGAAALATLNTLLDRAARDQRQDLILARTDHEFAGQHLMFRYLGQQFDGSPVDRATIQPAITSSGRSVVRSRLGAGRLASAFGPIVNEARVQYGDYHDGEQPQVSPSLVVWQGGSFAGQTGSSLFGPHQFSTNRLEAGDTISFVKGRHSLRLGADMLRDRNGVRFGPQTTLGFQSIPSLAAGLTSGVADWTTQILDTGVVHADVTQYAGFVQDGWRATNALTLDLGVRYDLQAFEGDPIRRMHDNWAPRVSLAISPGERRHTFRAAYGLFYGSTPALIPGLTRAFNGIDPRISPASIIVVDPSFNTPLVHQASAGWEVEKYRAGTFGVEYLFARGERLPRAVDSNIRGRLPGFERVVSFQSTAQSLYNGIAVHTRARVLQQLFYTITYTFARSDETPQQPIAMVFGGVNARNSLAVQGRSLDVRAPGGNDRHHQVSASAMYDTSMLAVDRHGLSKRLVNNWEFGLVYMLQTGQPYSAYVNGDLNGDGNAFNDVAPDTTWNQYRLPYGASVDPRVARRFGLGGSKQLTVIWEAFNLSNRPTYTAVDNTLYWLNGSSLVPNPLFGRRTAEANGRMMQLAARLTF